MLTRERIPPIGNVRVHAGGASHEGPFREVNEDSFACFDDAKAAMVVVADGAGGWTSGRRAADLVVSTCRDMFEGRSSSILDDLAEAWWRGEHEVEGPASVSGARARPYATLPIGDRVQLRERVKEVLSKRLPESMGDVAVLEMELKSL